MKKIIEKLKKYMPSKKFTIIACLALVLVLAVFLIFFGISKKENFSIYGENNSEALQTGDLTLEELEQKDTDDDGVVDWEEALWNTDKNKKATYNNMPDADYIANKKKNLNLEGEIIKKQEDMTETEKFASQFFTAFVAMKASGQVDAATINNFSSALGEKVASPDLIDQYSTKDLKISASDDDYSKALYYKAVSDAFEKYKQESFGDELAIVSTMLQSPTDENKKIAGNELSLIADAYRDFAKAIIGTSVPSSLATHNLNIANNANNLSISVRNMIKISDDPVIGLTGLSQYQKYSEALITSADELESTLPTDSSATGDQSAIINDVSGDASSGE